MATDVNDAGYAVGAAYVPSSQLAVVRWTPTTRRRSSPPTIFHMRGGPFIRNNGDVTWAENHIIKS